LNKVCEQIIKPTLAGMKSEGNPFVGCLYVGLMLENGNPKVVEFNVRFGDPETQAVLSIFKGNFAKLLYSAATGNIDKTAYCGILPQVACCLILASNGYPEKFATGFEITGNAYCERDNDIIVYHSGTKIIDNKLVTSGGRVLGITAVSDNIKDAITKAYKFAETINFENKYYRTDIGKRELER
jgi:phosphoribosylamine--glycine ligase